LYREERDVAGVSTLSIQNTGSSDEAGGRGRPVKSRITQLSHSSCFILHSFYEKSVIFSWSICLPLTQFYHILIYVLKGFDMIECIFNANIYVFMDLYSAL
jgi:hypothetical protein